MPSPLTKTEWIKRTIMPPEDVATIEAAFPDFLQSRLNGAWSWIAARLAKRYDVAAMAASPPEIVLLWITNLVTLDAYAKRGFNPSSEMDQVSIVKPADDAKAEVKEAADSQAGLFDLPLLESKVGTSGVTLGGPLGYSETSPYAWIDVQEYDGRADDVAGRGR